MGFWKLEKVIAITKWDINAETKMAYSGRKDKNKESKNCLLE